MALPQEYRRARLRMPSDTNETCPRHREVAAMVHLFSRIPSVVHTPLVLAGGSTGRCETRASRYADVQRTVGARFWRYAKGVCWSMEVRERSRDLSARAPVHRRQVHGAAFEENFSR